MLQFDTKKDVASDEEPELAAIGDGELVVSGAHVLRVLYHRIIIQLVLCIHVVSYIICIHSDLFLVTSNTRHPLLEV